MVSNATHTSDAVLITPTASAWRTLATLVPSLPGLAAMYEKFIVVNLVVKVVPTIPMTVGAVIAAGYEPDIHVSERIHPLNLADVMISKHHVMTNQVSEKTFSVRPINYRNEWCDCTDSPDDSNGNNGVLQYYSSYNGGANLSTIGYLDISFDIVFAGLHLAYPA